MELLIYVRLDDDLSDPLELRWQLEDEIERLELGEVLDAGVGVDAMEVYVGIGARDVEATTRAVLQLLQALGLAEASSVRAVESAPPVVVPPWSPGDCLSVQAVDDGDDDGEPCYGAAIVLARGDEGVLVGVLRYLSSQRPTAELFERREWLVLDHHAWDDETEVFWCFGAPDTDFESRVEVVGTTTLRATDPDTAASWRGASALVSQAVAQAAWDAEQGRPWPQRLH